MPDELLIKFTTSTVSCSILVERSVWLESIFSVIFAVTASTTKSIAAELLLSTTVDRLLESCVLLSANCLEILEDRKLKPLLIKLSDALLLVFVTMTDTISRAFSSTLLTIASSNPLVLKGGSWGGFRYLPRCSENREELHKQRQNQERKHKAKRYLKC